MCGIFGIYNLSGHSVDQKKLYDMESSMKYRGPDDRSFYLDKNVGLGMNRLSILDVDHGQQPFFSCGGDVVVFQNGEIYNYVELKKDLEGLGYSFQTHCDTEVIAKAYEEWGDECVHKFNGMFSICVYNKKEKVITLFRDRVGVKPLYYFFSENVFIFASEIKAILAVLSAPPKMNMRGVGQSLLYGYIPCPLTAFEGIYHVKPGSFIKISSEGAVKQKKWWNLSDSLHQQQKEGEDEASERVNDMLRRATEIRLRSDVEVGAFLSGGLDSSIVVGLAQENIQKSPMKTFSVGFEDKRFDETSFALLCSDRFSTDHKVRYMHPEDIKKWRHVCQLIDQPHSDISFVPTRIVSEEASKHLKVVLTGDGGDEVFGGYEKYHYGETLDFETRGLPLLDTFGLYKKEKLFIADQRILSGVLNNTDIINGALDEDKKETQNFLDECGTEDFINLMLAFDMTHLMPGNNLVKPDRMTMSCSLEARSPFLDYRLIEYGFGLPGDLKIRKGEKKYLLKKFSPQLIGEELTYRKKQMFTVPVGEWFKDQLSQDLFNLCESRFINETNIFNPEKMSFLVKEHISGKNNHTRLLRFLMSLSYHYENHYK